MAIRDRLNILSSALLITGVTIGIGIFGLPIKLGLAGIIPSFIAMLLTWAVMYMSGWIIVKRMLDVKDKTVDLFMGLELMKEFGLLRISPDIEYWPIRRFTSICLFL